MLTQTHGNSESGPLMIPTHLLYTPGHPHVCIHQLKWMHIHAMHGVQYSEDRKKVRRLRGWSGAMEVGMVTGNDSCTEEPHLPQQLAHLRFAADKGKEAEVQTGRGVEGALGLSAQARVCHPDCQF